MRVNLDCAEDVAQVDRSGMGRLITEMPRQVTRMGGLKLPHVELTAGRVDEVAVVGVGTTLVCAELAAALAAEAGKAPVVAVADWNVPSWIDAHTLSFVISFSGNTTEVLRCYDALVEKGGPVVAVTTGGRLREAALAKAAPVVRIPVENPPNRTIFPYLALPVPLFLVEHGLLPPAEVDLTALKETLDHVIAECGPHVATAQNPLKQLALACGSREPAVYTSSQSAAGVGRRWVYQSNENGKRFGFHGHFPQVSHNDAVAWDETADLSHLAPVFLREPEEAGWVRERIAGFQETLRRRGCAFHEFRLAGKSLLERLFSGILLGDLFSFYLAVANGIDPARVRSIDQIRVHA